MNTIRQQEKSILFVSYHFPPDAEVGAKRVSKLAAFLEEIGWNVGILTVKDKYHERIDKSLTTGTATIYKTEMFESIRFFMRGLKRFIHRLLGILGFARHARTQDASENTRSTHHSREASGSGFVAALRRVFFSIIWCPDDRQGWIPFGILKLLRLVGRYGLVYSSSPPYSVSLIPLYASFFRNRFIWVAELRDPWTSRLKPAFVVSRLSRWLERRWEAAVVKHCSAVVVVNDAMKRDLEERHPVYGKKILVHYNGYDENQIPRLRSDGATQRSGKFIFLHTGSFYHGRDPKNFLEVFADLIHEEKIDRTEVEIQFIGDSSANGTSISEIVHRLGIERNVKVLGYLPHVECLQKMSNTDVFLLFTIDQPLQVPAKFYEYLAFRKKILSISTGGITDRLIEMTGSGICVRPDDPEMVERAILSVFGQRQFGGNEEEIRKFSTKVIFRRLGEDLEALAHGKAR